MSSSKPLHPVLKTKVYTSLNGALGALKDPASGSSLRVYALDYRNSSGAKQYVVCEPQVVATVLRGRRASMYECLGMDPVRAHFDLKYYVAKQGENLLDPGAMMHRVERIFLAGLRKAGISPDGFLCTVLDATLNGDRISTASS